uniref:ATP synthase subunit 6 n=1 Tax=Amblyomma papuanum TaxID=3065601 RepID=UPI0030FEF919
MMNNLFSIFDPATSMKLSMNWMSMIIMLIIFPFNFWASSSPFINSWKILLKKIFQELMNNVNFNKFKILLFLLSMFMIILMSNIMGLLPYVFTSTSHLVFTMFFAFPFWITLILFSLFNKFNKTMSHLVPLGSPFILSFFMVIIESVSNLIRPITLSVRLTANMISGHLLIHLLSSLSMMNISLMFFTLPVMVCLMVLETAVAVIQSFVFITLISLYINEI